MEHHVARIHELRNCETCPHCKKLYSRISVHLVRCLENPDRKLERLKCPGCDKTYSDSKSVNVHLKKNICDGRLRSKMQDIHENILNLVQLGINSWSHTSETNLCFNLCNSSAIRVFDENRFWIFVSCLSSIFKK